MFFGKDRHDRRQHVAARAMEARARRTLVERWLRLQPTVSASGVQLRLNPAERKLAIGFGRMFRELDGSLLADAEIVTDGRPVPRATVPASRQPGAMVRRPAGGIAAGAGASRTTGPENELTSILVRVRLEVEGYEVLDFPIWSRMLATGPGEGEIRRAFARADELVRLCLAVRRPAPMPWQSGGSKARARAG